jgi:nitroreductase
MENQVLQAISERRSIRSYKPEQLTGEQLDILVQAALEAPTARDDQSWHFTVVQDKDLLEEINKAIRAKLPNVNDVFYAAPTAIFISGNMTTRWKEVDAGIAVQNIAIAAQAIGLGSVILGLPAFAFEDEETAAVLEKKLQFPADHKFMIAIAVGTPAASKEAHAVKENRVSYVK